MKLTPTGRKRLQLLTTIFLVLTVIAIIFTLAAWIVSEPGSFEPLNVLFFAVLSLLTAVSAWLGRAENVAPPESSAVAEAETIPLGPLRRQMSDSFDLNELRTLCLDIGINYDSLSGETIEGKTTSLLAYMQRRGQLPKLMTALQQERPHIHWPLPDLLRPLYSLRQNVRATWIDGILKQSVTDEIALELKLTYQPHTLTRKVTYVPGQVDRPVDKPLQTVLAEHGSLLILGEPGSGKTMTLLQLADALLIAADADPNAPTPIVLNLSSWAVQRGALEAWLVEEMLLQYQSPRATSRNWIATDTLLYLLDGLDEVAAEARDACVGAINTFQEQHNAPLVVCCRAAEYEGLGEKLNLGMGVRIRPLSQEQVHNFLARPEVELTAVHQMVQTDDALYDLAQTPLFLSVMSLAYRGMTAADLEQLETPTARRAHLYRHYVAEMWQRRPLNGNEGYDETQAMTWLTNLAHGMIQAEQIIFYMDRLQPTWLPTSGLHLRYAGLNGLIWGLLFGVLVWLLVGLSGGSTVKLPVSMIAGLSIGLPVGLISGLLVGLDSVLKSIRLFEEVIWSPPPFRQLVPEIKDEMRDGLFWGLFVGVILGIGFGLIFGVGYGLIFTVGYGLLVGMFGWLQAGIQVRNTPHPPQPNQSIRSSRQSGLRMAMVFWPFFGLLFGLLSKLLLGLFFGLLVGLIFGLIKYGVGQWCNITCYDGCWRGRGFCLFRVISRLSPLWTR